MNLQEFEEIGQEYCGNGGRCNIIDAVKNNPEAYDYIYFKLEEALLLNV